MRLKGKTVFVTGATGFLGGVLTHRLSDEGVQVKALARQEGRDRYIRDLPAVNIVQGDVTDEERVHVLAKGCDTIFHCAATTTGTLEEQRSVNAEGTRNIMRAANAVGVRRVVYVSTVSVYGYRVASDVTEGMLPNPGFDPYQITKAEAEAAVRGIAIQGKTTYSIIRPAMIYGPRSSFWTARMFKLAKRNPTPFIGSGQGTAHPIHVDDVVDMMLVLATHPAACCETFNCAPSPPPTWREYIGAYSALAGHNRWLAIPPVLVCPITFWVWLFSPVYSRTKDIGYIRKMIQQPVHYQMDKARELLGWEPSISLQDGVVGCADYLREEGLLT